MSGSQESPHFVAHLSRSPCSTSRRHHPPCVSRLKASRLPSRRWCCVRSLKRQRSVLPQSTSLPLHSHTPLTKLCLSSPRLPLRQELREIGNVLHRSPCPSTCLARSSSSQVTHLSPRLTGRVSSRCWLTSSCMPRPPNPARTWPTCSRPIPRSPRHTRISAT